MRLSVKLKNQFFILAWATVCCYSAQATTNHPTHGKHPFATPPGTSAPDTESADDDPFKGTKDHQWLTHSVNLYGMVNAKPTAEEQAARITQPWINQINIPYANQLGSTNGSNVLIGVADTVLEASHPQLVGKMKYGYNGYDGSNNVLKNQYSNHHIDHATAVSSAALGNLVPVNGKAGPRQIQGVALGASLAMAKVFNDQPTGDTWSWSAFAKSIDWFANTAKAPIVNLSLGGNSYFDHNSVRALKESIAKGTLFVIAAGNESQVQPSWPAAYANAAWAKSQIIIVGAVDKDNNLAYFSNAAGGGSLAYWYVVAPGQEIVLGSIGQTYSSTNGTSFSAPIVAGQAALIKSRWPHLTASTIASIIFQTATRLRSTASSSPVSDDVPDPYYGWGLVNVGKSLAPIGVLEVELSDGTKIPVAALGLDKSNLQGAIGSAIRVAAATKQFTIGGATDIYSRIYSVDAGEAIPPKPPQPIILPNMIEDADRESRAADVALDTFGSRLRYYKHQRATTASRSGLLAYHQGKANLAHAALVKRFANGNEIAAAVGGENIYMGLADYRIKGAPELNSAAFKNAYLGLVPTASSFGIGKKLENGVKFKLGLASTQFAQTMLMQSNPNFILQNAASQQSKVSMQNFEVSKQFSNTIVGLGVAGLGEQNALLGTQLGNGFSLNRSSKTRVLTFNMAHKPASDWVIAGYFSHGTTAGYNNPRSLISKVSTTYSTAYGFGFGINNAWRKADRFTANLSSPLTSIAGTMTLDLPTDMDIDGKLIRTQRQISLASPAREYRAEMAYFTQLSKATVLGLTLTHRHNANHIARATEQVALVNYRLNLD